VVAAAKSGTRLTREAPRYRPRDRRSEPGGVAEVMQATAGSGLGARVSAARRAARVLIRALRAFARSPRSFLNDAERYLSQQGGSSESALHHADVNGLPNVVPITFRVRAGSGSPHLNVLVPGMALWAMSGGPNTALNLTYRLAREGVRVRYISTDVAADDDETLWEHLRQVTGIEERLDNVAFVSAHDRSVATEISDDDIFFGTAWWTVQMIKAVLGEMRSPRFIYLIQDYEPGLYPWSTVHALALETYGLDFEAVINESVLMEYFVQNGIGRFSRDGFSAHCTVFEPAVDRNKFHVDPDAMDKEPRRLLFYARPNAPRNLYELGLLGLKAAVERGAFPASEWEFAFMGEQLPSVPLGKGAVIQSMPWLDYDGYASLLRGSTVGLALMLSPHTGYPALEMAACGMTVVTNTFATKTASRLRAVSPNLVAVSATLESVTEGLIEAWRRAADLDARASGAQIGFPRSWDDAFEPQVPRVLEMIEACRAVTTAP
jgi:WsaF, C-terminal domain/WsaF, N-terminal domain